MTDTKLAKNLSKLACEARRKAAYMKYIPENGNYEQQQNVSTVLEEFALKLEVLIAQHFVSEKLATNPALLSALSRQCRYAIRREIRKIETRQQYATICRP